MQEILKRNEESCLNILCFISGYMGDNAEFEEAFQSALENGINVD
jgi:hypothetical protein